MATPLVLHPGEAHLWYARPEEITDPARIAAYLALLTEEERARYARFHFDEHRHEYLVTRALERAALSRYADVPPSAWRFRRSADDKPELVPEPGVPPLRHNLSNTRGMVVCLVGLQAEVGVDVENVERRATLEVADRFFAASEVAALRRLPLEVQPARFFQYWTLKEAYVKARGVGVKLGLGKFGFELEGEGIAIRFFGLEDLPESWAFSLFELKPRHLVATAVRRTPGEPAPRITLRPMIPLEA
jgi:4'-phosphopantetheinyl transferase